MAVVNPAIPAPGNQPEEKRFLDVSMGARDWLLLVGLWTLPGLLTTWLIHTLTKSSWPLALVSQLPPWLFWVPATPLIVQIARAFPLDEKKWSRNLPVHIAGTVTFMLADIVVAGACERIFGASYAEMGQWPWQKQIWKLFSYYAELNVVCYWGIVAFGSAVDYHRRYRDREIAAARLETQLVQAQLEALKMQLHPHFLFNTLHAIAVLVRKGDQQGSIRMLAGVSDLLRIALENVGRQEVPLKDELDFLDRYLDVERTRFQDRLRIHREIATETLDARIPNLVLQPVVENAIRHGIEPRVEPGSVSIVSRREGDRLVVVVQDDGVGLAKAAGKGGRGMGLANVRARLEQLHPNAHRLAVEDAPGGGTRVTLEVPFQPWRPDE